MCEHSFQALSIYIYIFVCMASLVLLLEAYFIRLYVNDEVLTRKEKGKDYTNVYGSCENHSVNNSGQTYGNIAVSGGECLVLDYVCGFLRQEIKFPNLENI